MRKQAINRACEENSMDGALAALGKSVTRWTAQGSTC
jgi:hypothetical protein